jgi:hypothetical protein
MDPMSQPLQVIRQLFAAAGEQARSDADSFTVEQQFAALLRDPITRSQVHLELYLGGEADILPTHPPLL